MKEVDKAYRKVLTNLLDNDLQLKIGGQARVTVNTTEVKINFKSTQRFKCISGEIFKMYKWQR